MSDSHEAQEGCGGCAQARLDRVEADQCASARGGACSSSSSDGAPSSFADGSDSPSCDSDSNAAPPMTPDTLQQRLDEQVCDTSQKPLLTVHPGASLKREMDMTLGSGLSGCVGQPSHLKYCDNL